MAPRPDVSDERKSQIIEAAMNVFTRLGLNKARMDDIADESGLSKGALYWYFKSKDEIIAAILGSFIDRELEDLKAFIEKEGSAVVRLNHLVEMVQQDMKRMQRWMPLMYEFYALALRNARTRTVFTEYFRNYTYVLTAIIQQGINRGEIRPVSARDFAVAMVATLEGTFLVYLYDPENVNIESSLQLSLGYLLESVVINPA